MNHNVAIVKSGTGHVAMCSGGDYTSPEWPVDRAEIAAWAHERSMQLKDAPDAKKGRQKK